MKYKESDSQKKKNAVALKFLKKQSLYSFCLFCDTCSEEEKKVVKEVFRKYFEKIKTNF